MMGEQSVMQEELFYGFTLERHVPAKHLLRTIDRFVDLSGIRQHLVPYYSPIGRPSIDPIVFFKTHPRHYLCWSDAPRDEHRRGC